MDIHDRIDIYDVLPRSPWLQARAHITIPSEEGKFYIQPLLMLRGSTLAAATSKGMIILLSLEDHSKTAKLGGELRKRCSTKFFVLRCHLCSLRDQGRTLRPSCGFANNQWPVPTTDTPWQGSSDALAIGASSPGEHGVITFYKSSTASGTFECKPNETDSEIDLIPSDLGWPSTNSGLPEPKVLSLHLKVLVKDFLKRCDAMRRGNKLSNLMISVS